MTTQEFLNDVNVIIRCCEDARDAATPTRVMCAESVAYNQIKRRFEELKDELSKQD